MPKNGQKTGEADFKVGVFQEFFGTKKFTYRQEIDRIDFIITDNTDRHLIWAETKKNTADVVEMFVQLILTIGKGRTFDRYNPPPFLCVFDYKKIAFLQYNTVHDIFYQNDFNWNITPSDYKSKEFMQIKKIVENTINENNFLFYFTNDKQVLKQFINNNFSSTLELFPELLARIQIDKNNFIQTYNRWLEIVKPSIAIDWKIAKSRGIIDGDFYLADLLSEENVTLKEKLFVLLKKTNYELDRQIDDMGLFTSKSVSFKDNGVSHRHFWEIYIRPPKKVYWNYIIDRRDLLVPQDVRERKGSFFTPQQWVEKSQEYLSGVFGENWQDEYFIWDCAAGTGNLLVGLTNKYNIWASTLDRQDVDVMKDRIKNGANLLEKQVFQFDFLNGSFDDLPKSLQKIINDPVKCQKLIIYINPPYAEAGNQKMIMGGGDPKTGVSVQSKTRDNYQELIGSATNELSAQFMARIFNEMPNCNLALFSKLKFVCAQNFIKFRSYFTASYKKGFVVPSSTFDNVKGNFPIAFTIWELGKKSFPKKITVDVIDVKKGKKTFYVDNDKKSINHWIRSFENSSKDCIGYLICETSDFQKVHQPYITLNSDKRTSRQFFCNKNTMIIASIYFAVRLSIEPTWLNDRDLFLYPDDNWQKDEIFQNDCLAFALLHSQNRISVNDGTNHWIPYTAKEIKANCNFQSTFMSDYLKKIKFSPEAQSVINAGRELWKYYHKKIINHPTASSDASFYDIREFFQGRSDTGTMNSKSIDDTYNTLLKELKCNLSVLAEKIQPKVYEYGFLLK